MEGTIGEIRMFGGNFAPRNWALCQGQLLSVAENTALFSILGTIYGGDGRTTFALPDLRGRTPVGAGNGPGLSQINQGTKLGLETVTLTTAQIPAHAHTAQSAAHASGGSGTQSKPTGNTWAASGTNNFGALTPSTPLADGAVTTTVDNAGGGGDHENRPPQLGLNYIICLQGVYPSRS